MEEKISSELELAQLKQESFRRIIDHLHDRASSVISLTLQWKDVEDQFSSVQNAIEERLKELLLIQDSVEQKSEEVKKRENRLNVAEKSVEERFLEIEARENVLDLIRKNDVEERERDFEWIEKSRRELDAVSESIERKLKLLEEKEKRIELLNDSIDRKRGRIRENERRNSHAFQEIEAKQKQCERFLDELKLKEKRVEEKSKILALKEVDFSRSLLELEVKEKKLEEERKVLELKEKQIEEWCADMELVQKNFSERCTEVQLKEKQLNERYREFEVKEKQVEERSEIVAIKDENFSRLLLELDVKEKKLEEERKDLELKEMQIQGWCDEVELEKKNLMERCKEVQLKEKQLNQQYSELELKEKQVEERSEIVAFKDENLSRLLLELEVKEKKLEEERKELGLKAEKFKDLELKEMQIQELCKEVELEKQNLIERSNELQVKEKQLNEQYSEFELKEIQVEERSKLVALKDENFSRLFVELEVKEKKLEEERKGMGPKAEKFKDLELKEMQIQEWCKEVELEKKNLMEQCKKVQLKEKQFNGQYGEYELKERHSVEGHQNPYVINYAMDGKALQIFLNEHCGEYDSMKNDVLIALNLSSNPAKLVLDAMEGFYPPHLEKSDTKFEEETVKRSCILLLEQMMKISTEISPPVRKQAMRLAFDWSTKMKVDAEHSLEVLGFLQLLASYGLSSSFGADELLAQLELIVKYSQAPELFRALGFADKISGFIENLIRKKQFIEAIRFTYAFELVSKFPPVPLLNDYLEDSKKASEQLRRETKSLEGEIQAADRRIADLRCAIRCIEDCKIDSRANLKLVVEFLEKENSERKGNLAVLGHELQRSPHNKKNHLAPTAAVKVAPVLPLFTASAVGPPLTSFATTASIFVSVNNTQSQQITGNKRPWATMSAEDDLNTCYGDHQETCALPFQGKFEQSSLVDLPLGSKKALASPNFEPSPNGLFVNESKEELRQLISMLETQQWQDGRIAAALRSSSDPGKLVLYVMTVFFPFKLERNKDSESPIPKKSCIFLLQQLRKISPQINAEINEQAKKLALKWKTILAKNRESPLEVICFLQFLATYRLASLFNANELLSLLDTDHWCKEAPDLCQVLGLNDKIPSFVEDYIKKAQHLEAIKYIYALDIVDKFPPAPILKDHLSLSNSSRKRSKSIGGEIADIINEIKSLQAVIKCTADYKILGLSIEDLRARIVQLKHRKERLHRLQASKAKRRSVCKSTAKLDQQVSAASAPRVSASTRTAQLPQQSRNKRHRIHFSKKPPPSCPPGLFTRQDVPGVNEPHEDHNLAAYPPYNSYSPSVIPSYHWTAFGNPGYDGPPLTF